MRHSPQGRVSDPPGLFFLIVRRVPHPLLLRVRVLNFPAADSI